jgi:hypothetical protein
MDSETYRPVTEHDGDHADPLSPGIGLDLFEAAHARLEALGLRALDVHLADRDRTHYRPTSRSSRTHHRQTLGERHLGRLGGARVAVAQVRQVHAGVRKLALIDAGGTSRSASCEQAALSFALRCLAEATACDPGIADVQDQLGSRCLS